MTPVPKSSSDSFTPMLVSSRSGGQASAAVEAQGLLGEVEAEPTGVDARPPDRLGHVVGELGVGQVARADVGGDEQRLGSRAQGVPLGDLVAGLVERPPSDDHAHAGLLEHGQEVAGEQDAGVGGPGRLPAQQGFEADQRAGVDPHDGLVVQDELVVVDGVTQAGLVDPRLVAAPLGLVVDLPVRALVAGPGQRSVGVADQVVDVGVVVAR